MDASSSRDLRVLGQQVRIVTVTETYSMVDIVAPAGVPGPPLHLHQDCSELFYVLEGEIEVITDTGRSRLGVGQSTVMLPNALHTFHNPTDAPVRIISVYSPAGFERFFEAFGIPGDHPDAQRESIAPEVVGRVVSDAAKYGMVIPPPAV